MRILLAAVAGFALGLEREVGGHPAGARTHLLVAVGACLFTVAGGYALPEAGGGQTDPTRIAAQVASGIGFLGAGTIIRSGATVRGLTTAATIWISGALGVAAGVGAFIPLGTTLGVVLLGLVGLSVARPLLRRVSRSSIELRLVYELGSGTLGPLVRGVTELEGRVDDLVVEDEPDAGVRRVLLRARIRDRAGVLDLVTSLQRRPEVREVTIK